MADDYSPLWSDDDGPFWKDLKLKILNQTEYGTDACVPTSLAIVASAISRSEVQPEHFMEVDRGKNAVNTQSPQDWSDALQEFGGHLAYCNFDGRALDNYIPELIEYDDLFVIGFYSNSVISDAEQGKSSGGSHMVTMYKGQIFDSMTDSVTDAVDYPRKECAVKRIFRVVKNNHPRKV